MKSLMFLWRLAAEDLSVAENHASTLLDYKKLEERVKHEGDEFLTITLPAIAQTLERGLETGAWDPSLCTGFRHKGGLPLFLGGYLDRVFDRKTGRLLEQPDVDSIFAIRQLSLMFKKILIPCSDARVKDAMERYVQVDKEVAEWNWESEQDRSDFVRMSTLIFGDTLASVESALIKGELVPKHGPGATADGLRGNKKYLLKLWPQRLEDVFAYIEYALPNLRYHTEIEDVTFLEPEMETPVKVVSVPKTLKTPRIIAEEPTCMQFMQQAISNKLVQVMEAKHIAGNTRLNVCAGFLGFRHQYPNRVMAQEGSLNGRLATLDMSDASDRVSNKHVIELLARFPHLSEAVQAVRSTKAYVQGLGVIPLAKYASMGSALTFPLEAMVFTTAIYLGLERLASRQFTRDDIKSFSGFVRVYGDDLIVPTNSVDSVITMLEGLGLKVNSNKSFWNGKFRESCGGDFYDGRWVTPVYVRREFPRSRKHVAEIESLVSLRNQFYLAGLWKVAAHLDSVIGGVLPHFPIVESTSSLLGRTSFLPYQAERMSAQNNVPLVKGYIARRAIPSSELDGVGALYKCLSAASRRHYDDVWSPLYPDEVDKRHLQRAGRPRDAGLHRGWRPPY